MSEELIKDEMLNWKNSLEKEIVELKKQIEKNDLNAKINEYKRNIIEHASEQFSIADDVRQNFFKKYGQSLQTSLDEYYQNDDNNKLSLKIRELKSIIHTIEKWVQLNC